MNTFSIIIGICAFAILAANARRIHHRAISCGSSAIPGMNVFERGIDVTQLNIYHCSSPQGLKRKLFNYDDCSDGQRWKFEKGNRTYSVPNTFKLYMRSQEVSEKADLLTTLGDIRKKFSETVEIDEFHEDLFSNSDVFIKLQEELGSRSILIAKNHYEYYSVEVDDLRKSNQVSNELLNSVRLLPPNFDRIPVPYIDLIKEYGTHYIRSGVFGGVVQRITAVPNNTTKDKMLAEEIGNKDFPDFLPFPNNRGVCYSKDYNNIAKFQNLETEYGYAWFEQSFLGGKSDLIWIGGGYERWVLSIPEQVYLIKVRLEPISDLMSDNYQRQMESAIAAYVARGKLDEEIRALKLHIKNQTINTNTAALSAEELLKEAENMRQEDNYNVKRIREMIGDIQKEIKGEKSLPFVDTTTTTTSTSTSTSFSTTSLTTSSAATEPTVSTSTDAEATPKEPQQPPVQKEIKDGKSAGVTIAPNFIVFIVFIINSVTVLNYLK